MKFNTPEASSAHSGGKLVLETKHKCHGNENFEKLLLLMLTKTSNSNKVCLTKKNIDTDTEKYCNILVRY